jgi:hypothetical protein
MRIVFAEPPISDPAAIQIVGKDDESLLRAELHAKLRPFVSNTDYGDILAEAIVNQAVDKLKPREFVENEIKRLISA